MNKKVLLFINIILSLIFISVIELVPTTRPESYDFTELGTSIMYFVISIYLVLSIFDYKINKTLSNKIFSFIMIVVFAFAAFGKKIDYQNVFIIIFFLVSFIINMIFGIIIKKKKDNKDKDKGKDEEDDK